jgi:hypothetical protein
VQDAAEATRVLGIFFPTDFEAGRRPCLAHEVEPDMANDGHVLRSELHVQPRQIFVEDGVAHPMQTVSGNGFNTFQDGRGSWSAEK